MLPEYSGQDSFFGGSPPLSQFVGYFLCIFAGLLFSIITTVLVHLDYKYAGSNFNSEQFNTAGRTVKTGLTASVIVSQWTWAATLLQSSNVAWAYGVSGPFWYASGASIQVLLFGIIAIEIKNKAPKAHTMCELVKVRWGTAAHITFLIFSFLASTIVTSMLLLGGAATMEALTGMNIYWAGFLIPWGVMIYTVAGGLKATFMASYIHTAIIMTILVVFVYTIYVKAYSSDDIYDMLQITTSHSEEDCDNIFSKGGVSFRDQDDPDFSYACGKVADNRGGSYLTMISLQGFIFGVINVIGNFGTVFVDQSYWQSAIAATPQSAHKGYLLGGLVWFTIPFALATSLGLASTALQLPITAAEAGSGLVPPAVATHLYGQSGALMISIMLFMAIVSTGSAEAIAVSSLCAYDIYREYINPEATGKDILKVSQYVIVGFCLLMGGLSAILNLIGLSLGWVYLFMGIIIGSAVIPLWNMMMWDKASGTGAVVAAWVGQLCAIVVWMVAASIDGGGVSVATLGGNYPMLAGNLTAILLSGFIHICWSLAMPQNYDWQSMKDIKLIEDDQSGLDASLYGAAELKEAKDWIMKWGLGLTVVIVILWPALSVPEGVFTKGYFAFWVFISVIWGFVASATIIVLPIYESWSAIVNVLNGIMGKETTSSAKEETANEAAL
jgi:SSS family transporter